MTQSPENALFFLQTLIATSNLPLVTCSDQIIARNTNTLQAQKQKLEILSSVTFIIHILRGHVILYPPYFDYRGNDKTRIKEFKK